jgi:hypothetical protein
MLLIAPRQNLVSTFEPARVLADAHFSQQGNIERGIDPAVQIPTSGGDTTLPLEHSQMVRCYAELLSRLCNVHYAAHFENS